MQDTRQVRRIIDAHHHVGQLNVGTTAEATSPEAAAQKHVQIMDRFGMDAAVVMPSLQYERPNGIVDTRRINDAIAAYRDRDPTRFPAALGTTEPLYGATIGTEEIRRIATELRLDGVVWHNRFQGTILADTRIHAFVDECTELGLPCFVHIMAESALEAPWALAELARDHPSATLVALDAFSGFTQSFYIFDIAERHENVMFDTAISFPLMRRLDSFVQRFGSERLLFGTDVYVEPVSYNSPAVLHELLASPLPEDDLENIMWRNLVRLFPHVEALVDRASGEGIRDPA